MSSTVSVKKEDCQKGGEIALLCGNKAREQAREKAILEYMECDRKHICWVDRVVLKRFPVSRESAERAVSDWRTGWLSPVVGDRATNFGCKMIAAAKLCQGETITLSLNDAKYLYAFLYKQDCK